MRDEHERVQWMFGFFSRKTNQENEERRQQIHSLTEMTKELGGRIEGIEDRLQQMQRAERRRDAALEGLLEDQSSVLKTLTGIKEESSRIDAILTFAESMTLWLLQAEETGDASGTNEIKILASKLRALLAEFGLASIAETGVPFDTTLHEACASRSDPGRPERDVLEIVRPGFLCEGRVLRCATVVVNRRETIDEEGANS